MFERSVSRAMGWGVLAAMGCAGCGDAASGSEASASATSAGPNATGTVDPTATPTDSAEASASTPDLTTSLSTSGGAGETMATTGPAGTTGTTGTTVDSVGEDSTTGAPVGPGECAQSVDGWCWVHPLPSGNALRDVWSDGTGRTWVVGEGSTIMVNDGDGWTNRVADRVENLRGVWGSAPDDVWAVGDFGVILHFDGETWEPVASPTKRWLRGVWGSGPADVYAVGDQKTLLHFDGQAWAAYDPGIALSDMLSVWGSGPGDVWIGMVGFGGGVAHYDGKKWGYLSTEGDGGVTALWGRGPGDVYAASSHNPLLHHFGGQLPWVDAGVKLNAGALNAVAGTDSEVWAGGTYVLLHNEQGDEWSEVEGLQVTETLALERVDDDILAVGRRGMIDRMHAGTWSVEAGSVDPPFRHFSAIAGHGEDDLWAGGNGMAHWDGETWTFVDIGLGSNGVGSMTAVDGVVYAVSANENIILWRHDGQAWSKAVETGGFSPSGLWAASANDVWLSADFGGAKLMHWDGQTLTPYKLAFNASHIGKLHGLASDDIWGVGPGELLIHWDGDAWTKVHSANGNDLSAVWAAGPDDVWCADDDGEFYHWDGVTWTPYPGSIWPINSLRGTGPDDIWAVGGLPTVRGTTWHWDGAMWSEKVSGTGEILVSLWSTDQAMWAVGAEHSVLRRPH